MRNEPHRHLLHALRGLRDLYEEQGNPDAFTEDLRHQLARLESLVDSPSR
jgi:hypothetical protein